MLSTIDLMRMGLRGTPLLIWQEEDTKQGGGHHWMKQGPGMMLKAVPTGGHQQQEGDERVQVTTQMKWDWPLMEMRQQEVHPSTGGKGSSSNKWHHKMDGEDRRDEEEEQCHRQCCKNSI
ncbi:hypothetical protein NDA10_005575 [Ustilago hordei]|nr:hypothetical protein NDA10_005575 [Ustilago hordei]UTT96604.1 hypothetical protein NDA17_006744 [Ustilago hordei]